MRINANIYIFFNNLFYHLFMRRIYPLGIEPESINRCDAMLVSHNHPDHFSHHALVLARKLGSTIIGPPGVIRRARRHGISNCHELQPGERCDLAGMQITAVPAVHPLSRSAIGFFIESEKNVYFSGDTRFDWRIVDALRDKPVDVAFLQVSCTFHTLLWGSNGMDINYADELARAVRPKCVIPMHFDCIHKYLDIVTDRRVSEHSLDIEDALNS